VQLATARELPSRPSDTVNSHDRYRHCGDLWPLKLRRSMVCPIACGKQSAAHHMNDITRCPIETSVDQLQLGFCRALYESHLIAKFVGVTVSVRVDH
jgi:hypothetical protein